MRTTGRVVYPEKPVRRFASSRNGDRRQLCLARNVTDCKDAFHRGILVCIHGNMAFVRKLHADLDGIELFDLRGSADRP